MLRAPISASAVGISLRNIIWQAPRPCRCQCRMPILTNLPCRTVSRLGLVQLAMSPRCTADSGTAVSLMWLETRPPGGLPSGGAGWQRARKSGRRSPLKDLVVSEMATTITKLTAEQQQEWRRQHFAAADAAARVCRSRLITQCSKHRLTRNVTVAVCRRVLPCSLRASHVQGK